MSQPLYFLPNTTAGQLCNAMTGELDRKLLASNGLAGIFADVKGKDEIAVTDIPNKGPDGNGGVIFTYLTPDGKIPDRFGFYTDHQTWQQCGSFWIGYELDNPPKESDLRRKRRHRGYELESDDGQLWEVPIVRRPDDSTELPCAFSHGDDGKLRETPKAAYVDFWNRTAKVCGWFFNDDGVFGGATYSKPQAVNLAIEALAINYRFGQAEQGITGLVDSTNFATILGFAVDYPRFFAISRAEKKSSSQLTMPNITTGQTGDSPDTLPAGQTST